jgi:hypothetical protein
MNLKQQREMEIVLVSQCWHGIGRGLHSSPSQLNISTFLWEALSGFSCVLQYQWVITRLELETKRLTNQNGLG